MDIFVVIAVVYLGPPLAAVMFFSSAWMLRDVRPKRAKLVIWTIASLPISGAALAVIASVLPISPIILEPGFVVVLGAIGTIATLGTAALLMPLPDRGAPIAAAIIGIMALGGALFWAYELSNTNFGL
ncbi:hypothetical protein L0664_13890 [Octadecabacter sp. G9-8]|uniref:Uncharacterized protein n=1 Tax=Octadecabacter dasysiphoniae TaxID=2909341 RepID=A0ABS9D1I8_9RHOB|nr:hypothetical protein [Octadecabacter dasysiphoniae]MCF2872163.1 hypothetical protein [Octadecabacter dasysiphoniae]